MTPTRTRMCSSLVRWLSCYGQEVTLVALVAELNCRTARSGSSVPSFVMIFTSLAWESLRISEDRSLIAPPFDRKFDRGPIRRRGRQEVDVGMSIEKRTEGLDGSHGSRLTTRLSTSCSERLAYREVGGAGLAGALTISHRIRRHAKWQKSAFGSGSGFPLLDLLPLGAGAQGVS